jgi:hypothetical protein
MAQHSQNSPKSKSGDSPARIRPDEQPEGKAEPNPRHRGSWKKLSSRRKMRKHSRRR